MTSFLSGISEDRTVSGAVFPDRFRKIVEDAAASAAPPVRHAPILPEIRQVLKQCENRWGLCKSLPVAGKRKWKDKSTDLSSYHGIVLECGGPEAEYDKMVC